MRKPRATFSDEFKLKAIKLVEKLGSQKEAAKQLGVSEVNLCHWRQKYGAKPIPSVIEKSVKSNKIKNRIQQLEAENQALKETNESLKQLLAALSQKYIEKI